MTDVHFSSASDEWATPPDLFTWAQHTFGLSCSLDVCATKGNAKCKRYYTREDNGLKLPWHGVCWMNPPYGRTIGKWVERAHDFWLDGGTVLALLPARTDTAWFHDFVFPCTEITFLRGRVHFLRPDGSSGPAPFPSMLVLWRPGP
jgi:site-specific DNA-methyltransferase (adenine-specific)